MSEESKLQVREYLQDMYNIFLQDIGESRGLEVAKLKQIADGYLIRSAEDAVSYKLVDGALYMDQVLDQLKSEIGLGEDDKLKIDLFRRLCCCETRLKKNYGVKK